MCCSHERRLSVCPDGIGLIACGSASARRALHCSGSRGRGGGVGAPRIVEHRAIVFFARHLTALEDDSACMLFLHDLAGAGSSGPLFGTNAEDPSDMDFCPAAERSLSEDVPFLDLFLIPCADLSQDVPLLLFIAA